MGTILQRHGWLRLTQLALGAVLVLLAIGSAANVTKDKLSLEALSSGKQEAFALASLPQSSVASQAPQSVPSTVTQPAPSAAQALPKPFIAGEVIIPESLFSKRGPARDKAVLASNPRVYIHPEFDPRADHIFIIGMPGWGGRSENFIWTMINGLRQKDLPQRLVIAAIQDTSNGGPKYQGQGDRAHANVWSLTQESVNVMHHFVAKISGKLNRPQVYFLGYSTGGTAAPVLATRLGQIPAEGLFSVKGAIAHGTGSSVNAELLKAHNQRVLFITVPERARGERKILRDDQWNRVSAETSYERLVEKGATAYIRHVNTAKRHNDWHWGLISQCRFFPSSRIDDGRGYWPNYWMPNPESFEAIETFILGQAPAAQAKEFPPTDCPC